MTFCRHGRPASLCLTCELPPRIPAAGFPHHLVDFELWLRNQHQALSAFGAQFAEYQAQMVHALALIDQFREAQDIENACPVAINLGDDVAAQTTAAPAYAGGSAEAGAAVAAPSAVPVGNTGTTSTGQEL